MHITEDSGLENSSFNYLHYYVTSGMNVLEEYSRGMELDMTHIYHGNERIVTIADINDETGDDWSRVMHFTINDHLGSPMVLTPGTQVRNYYPYGAISYGNGHIYDYGFTGKEREKGPVFHYFGARHYNPFTARFTSCDPKADKYPSLSPYTYCAGNPVNYVDADGEEVIDATTGKQINRSDMEERTLECINKILANPLNSKLNLDVFGRNGRATPGLRQTWGGRNVSWGGPKDHSIFGFSRFTVNTMFSLNNSQKDDGMYVVGDLTGISEAKDLGKDIYRVTFGANRRNGDTIEESGRFITLIGTIEEINDDIKDSGWKLQYNKNDSRYDFRKVSNTED